MIQRDELLGVAMVGEPLILPALRHEPGLLNITDQEPKINHSLEIRKIKNKGTRDRTQKGFEKNGSPQSP